MEKDRTTKTDIEMESRRTQARTEAERDLRRSAEEEERKRGREREMETESRKSPEEIERDLRRTRAEMEDTIEAIERKLSPGELLDQTLRTLGGGPREYAANLSQAVKLNPIPATLVGVGLAWLMAGSGRQPVVYEEPLVYPLDVEEGETGAMAKRKYGQAKGKAEAMADRVREGLGRFSQTFAGRRKAAEEQFGQAEEKVSGLAGYAGERIARARTEVGGMAEEVGGQARLRRGRAQGLLEEQPLILTGLGFTLGLALGSFLSPSETEDRLMGEYRDELMEEAKEVGREKLEEGERLAAKAGETAREEKTREPEPAI
jgi:hypothetical protein